MVDVNRKEPLIQDSSSNNTIEKTKLIADETGF